MNRFLSILIAFCLAQCWCLAQIPPIPGHCITKIDAVSAADPNSLINSNTQQTFMGRLGSRKLMQEYPHLGHANKDPNYQLYGKIWTSLADFITLASPHMTEKGMEGYLKLARQVVRDKGSVVTIDRYLSCLKDAFTPTGGGFNKIDFNDVMSQIADEAFFDFTGKSGALVLKNSKAKILMGEIYQQGESDTITHILRGHTKNEFTDDFNVNADPLDVKGVFLDPKEVLRLLDEAMGGALPKWQGPQTNSFIVKFNKDVGVGQGGYLTGTKTQYMLVFYDHHDHKVIRTAYPYDGQLGAPL